jgi:hypothetical protein
MKMERRYQLSVLALGSVLGLAGCGPSQTSQQQQTASVVEVAPLSSVDMGDPQAAVQLVSGFHKIEQNRWRWTTSKFQVRLGIPPEATADGTKLMLQLTLPDVVIKRLKSVELRAKVNGTSLPPARYSKSGQYVYSRPVPAEVLHGRAVMAEFELDNYIPAGAIEARELGVVALKVGLYPL